MAKVSGYTQKRSRPLSITLIAWGIFLLGLANGWRAIGLSRQGQLLIELAVVPEPRPRLIVALCWMATFFVLAILLWCGRRATRWAIPAVLATYGLYQLALMLLFFQSADALRGWPLTTLLHLLVVVVTAWFLNRSAYGWYFEARG